MKKFRSEFAVRNWLLYNSRSLHRTLGQSIIQDPDLKTAIAKEPPAETQRQ